MTLDDREAAMLEKTVNYWSGLTGEMRRSQAILDSMGAGFHPRILCPVDSDQSVGDMPRLIIVEGVIREDLRLVVKKHLLWARCKREELNVCCRPRFQKGADCG